ncbi:hypothetical protein [Thermoanaerobacter sp. A7A]|uniref:hypothetical protein n=1 Tax=Thermoanaerobacter sp. A7A TaxID=1350366 RepID=UPI000408EE04|nr:hypothetical protein [Thermoanaerobacter sp. A7A]
MIDLKTGEMVVNSDLVLSPKLSLEEFKKTRYYTGQDEKMYMGIGGPHKIDGKDFYIKLCFENSHLKEVSLSMDSPLIKGWNDEPKLKAIHDEYLKSKGIKLEHKWDEGNYKADVAEFEWGKIVSDFDSKSYTSNIVVIYK